MIRMLYFKNNTCSVCSALFPRLEKLAEVFPVHFETIDVTENPMLAGQHLVFTVPALLFLDDRGSEIKRFVRHFSEYEVKVFMERIFDDSSWS